VVLLAHYVGFRLLGRLDDGIEAAMIRHSRKPLQFLLPILVILLGLPALNLSPGIAQVAARGVALAVIATIGLTIAGLLAVLEELVAQRYSIAERDNLSARAIRTRMRVFRSVGVAAIALITLSTMLMTFPSVRQLGVSLLASAGLATLVVGMAARPALSNLIAGMQVALTQPIRIDDVLVVDGEWGRVEEITTSFVVLRIWDSRTLVIPLSYLVERPVENWTRSNSELLAAVTVYADYNVPVEEVRRELGEIVRRSPHWDGRFWNLQVTNATERSIELRALMSARDGSEAWELRCEIRERLIGFLQRRLAEALPRERVTLSREDMDGSSLPAEAQQVRP
jgi:small-conductance mechanosensitive channel